MPLERPQARRRTSAFAPLETRDGALEDSSGGDTEAPYEPSRATLFVRLPSRSAGVRWLTRLSQDPAVGAVPRARAPRSFSGLPSVGGPLSSGGVRVQVALSTELASALSFRSGGVPSGLDAPFEGRGANAAVVLTAEDPGALKSLVVRHILFAATHGGSVTEVHGEDDGEPRGAKERDAGASGRRSRDGLSKSQGLEASGVRAALLEEAREMAAPPKGACTIDPLPWVKVHDTWLLPQQGQWVSAAPR